MVRAGAEAGCGCRNCWCSNAGKSTFLSVISAAQPTIANYPFTTLLPNLGVVSFDYNSTMVVADLPGLLEGAHQGFGLGHEFLRHTERCSTLVGYMLELVYHFCLHFNKLSIVQLMRLSVSWGFL